MTTTTIRTDDSREFPVFEGKALSWSPALYFTPAEERYGYPRARAVIAAMKVHRPEVLEQERREMQRAIWNPVFRNNARRYLELLTMAG